MLSSLYFHKIYYYIFTRLRYTKLNIYYIEQSFLDPLYIELLSLDLRLTVSSNILFKVLYTSQKLSMDGGSDE